MKLTPREFGKLTPREFYGAVKDHEEQKEIQSRPTYIATRKICATIWNAAGKRLVTPIRNLEEFMPMTWERQARLQRKQTPDEMKEVLMSLAKTQNKRIERQKRK